MTYLIVTFPRLSLVDDGGLLAEPQVKPTLANEIKAKQPLDMSLLPTKNMKILGLITKVFCASVEDEFAYNNSVQSSIQMAPYEALYGHKFQTLLCWTELGERKILGPKVVKKSNGKIRLIQDRLKVASDRQKLYANLKRKDIEYSVRDHVFLKVSPWRKMLKFGRKGKLSPRFIGPYRIIKRVGLMAYQLELQPNLDCIHDVFHVSILKRCRLGPSRSIPIEEIKVRSICPLRRNLHKF
ncbi:DNA/RNA polymerase superfamily protein [Gossypium australe]|uniref:DNA/RNA polymerase superfamily protein n=1 Tax=Gossypium australe TaxID=47621 RepID=A0A5B6WUK7_9ROSI|nr:DNA/RNA polymerase superfamily protein [Gossypium australe]